MMNKNYVTRAVKMGKIYWVDPVNLPKLGGLGLKNYDPF